MCIINYIYYIREPLRAPIYYIYNIYYNIGEEMLEVFLGALLAVAVHDIFYELYNRYKSYKYKKDLEALWDLAEDFEADDEDI